jgi:hypothetical protein
MYIILSRLVYTLDYVLFVILFIHYDDINNDIVIDSHIGYNTQSKIRVARQRNIRWIIKKSFTFYIYIQKKKEIT